MKLEYPKKVWLLCNDNECFKWCLVRNLHPENHNQARIRKVDKDFAKNVDSKDKISHKNERDLQHWKKE